MAEPGLLIQVLRSAISGFIAKRKKNYGISEKAI